MGKKKLEERTKSELVKMAKQQGIEANIFWSKTKIIRTMQEAKDHPLEQLPPEVKQPLQDLATDVEEDAAPTETKLSLPAIKRYLVTWRGASQIIAHSILQHHPKITFQRGVEVDLYEAYLAELGTAHKTRVEDAKALAAEAGPLYAKSAKMGSYWLVRTAMGPITVAKDEGARGSAVDQLLHILEGPVDAVMAYVRKMREGNADPLIKGEPSGNQAIDRREDISLTISMLYTLERESPRARQSLERWLFDEQRELQGLNKLYTDQPEG